MTLNDASNPYWKQKFIEGLPTQFGNKVKESLRPGPNEEINWNSLHYGQLQTAYTQQGLLLCNDLCLKKQLKRDHISAKTLGNFCQQFAYENLPEPKCKACKGSQPYRQRSKSPYRRRPPPKPSFRGGREEVKERKRVKSHNPQTLPHLLPDAKKEITYEIQRWRNYHSTKIFETTVTTITADIAEWKKSQKPRGTLSMPLQPYLNTEELKAWYLRKYPQAIEDEAMKYCLETAK
ncbi:hypothetical protein H6P81_010457 [Aristolochia fimbriata]|uniref:Uncharacterized protein n=1 Tax=Aristolochia fimbriata TaxID=158543 RepID=A0AAV7ES84_ARIFI|nr:hypothetical protein H6P81_010457 [Aristolochia fimbriata]